MSVEAYKAEMEFLREELAQKEKDVARAAEIGKCLLETNQDLEEQMEKQQKDNQLKIDEINQECYTLKKKLESKNFMEQNYLDDIEKMKAELRKHRNNQETAAELELQVKLAELKKQNGYLQQELEKTQLSEKQSLEKINDLSEEVESLRSQLSLQESRFNDTCSEEMAKLLSEVANLQKEKVTED
ncbi:protein Spindly-like [Lineus longissimus]|uniref:protein Spindly-like n=1 Tax=Lineus longissimus TaxID=88925 RepID=UPI00315C7165